MNSRNIATRIGAIESAQRCRIDGKIPSSPGANEGLSLSIALKTNSSSTDGRFGIITCAGFRISTFKTKEAAKLMAKISQMSASEFPS